MDRPITERVVATTRPDDRAVVTELHELHGARLFDFARHQGLTDDQAADVVQEAMIRLWRELGRGTVVENPLAWTFRTAYRLAMEQHRWRRRLAAALPRLAPVHPEYAGPEASDGVTVWKMVDELPLRQRQVLYLHYAVGMPFEDIATVIGISASAARTHASRGLGSLRGRLVLEEAT